MDGHSVQMLACKQPFLQLSGGTGADWHTFLCVKWTD